MITLILSRQEIPTLLIIALFVIAFFFFLRRKD